MGTAEIERAHIEKTYTTLRKNNGTGETALPLRALDHLADRGPELDSQHPQGSSQSSATLVLGGPGALL